MISINFLTVFIAALAAFIIGFLLHGPILGKVWMKLANVHPTGKEKFSDMIGQMIWNLVANIVTAAALAVFIALTANSPFLNSGALVRGLTISFIVWIGFNLPTTSIEVIWMGRKFNHWLFEAGCSLIVMLAMGAIIACW